MYIDEYITNETETFHEILRSCVTIFLIFIILLIISHIIISKLKIKQNDDIFFVSKSDQCAYQVALLTCTFSLAITLAATALLPLSIISNEIIIHYPNSYYMQWINTSLIQNLWNTVSFSSNITIFILMPFATLFLDSEGFSGLKNNIHNRIMEAICFFSFTLFMILGAVWIICIPFRENHNLSSSLKDLWHFYLPLVHSSVSLIGVVILCVLSPLGCLNLIITFSKLLQSLTTRSHKTTDDLIQISVELHSLDRKLNNKFHQHLYSTTNKTAMMFQLNNLKSQTGKKHYFIKLVSLLLAIVLTTTIVLLLIFYVVLNTVGIVIGLQVLPRSRAEIELGRFPSSRLGWFGAAVQIVLIQYLLLSSVWALYHVSPMRGHMPEYRSTNIQTLIRNAMCMLLVCSAIPIQSRLLGITTFNPLGTFGHFDWLDSSVLVLAYNVGFLVLLSICTFKKIVQNASHKVVLVDSVRQVMTYLDASPNVVRILSSNLLAKNQIKTA